MRLWGFRHRKHTNRQRNSVSEAAIPSCWGRTESWIPPHTHTLGWSCAFGIILPGSYLSLLTAYSCCSESFLTQLCSNPTLPSVYSKLVFKLQLHPSTILVPLTGAGVLVGRLLSCEILLEALQGHFAEDENLHCVC